MATIRLKRRSATGAAGAPSALKGAEPAYSEKDNVLYYGFGDDGSGNATSIISIGGFGAYVARSGAQTIDDVKTFTSSPIMPTPLTADSSQAAATTAFVKAQGYAPLASPAFTGNPTVPTAAADTNSTQVATTSFVLGQAATTTPNADGTAAVGTSTRFARADHVHPTDTSRAPLNSPGLTGSPTAPTPANGNSSTAIATTAFVLGTRLDQLAAATSPISGVDPTQGSHLATKNYVDSVAQGLNVKPEANYATAAPLPANTRSGNVLTASANGVLTVDGTAMTAGKRVVVKNEATFANNGIYEVTNPGASGAPFVLTRSADFNAWTEIPGSFVFVEAGTVNANTGWVASAPSGGTLNSSAITFMQFSGAGTFQNGDGLSLNGNVFAVLGTANRITVSSAGVDIAATYVGQTSITTLGTIGTGTWQATAVGLAYGGTGGNLSALTNGVLLKKQGTALVAAVAGTDFLDNNSTIDGGTF